MKKVALVFFTVSLSLYASGRVVTKKSSNNRYFSWSHTEAPNKIPCDSMIYYCKFMDVYYPMYHDDMIIVMAAIDEKHQFVYHRSGKYFEKIPLTINGNIFKVTGCDLSVEPPTKKESYLFSCVLAEGTKVSYFYDLDTHSVKQVI